MVKDKRMLDDKEKAICEKSIKAREFENDWLLYQIKYHELMIEGKGLYLNYLKKENEFKMLSNEMNKEILTNQDVIDELKRQIKEGVETKEVADEKEDSFKKFC